MLWVVADPHDHWQDGIAHFNSGRYWEAHEAWERGWKNLPEPSKTYVQALIQATSSFYLVGEGRIAPALSLCRLAKAKLASVGWPGSLDLYPRIEIPGLIEALDAVPNLRPLRAELLFNAKPSRL